MKLKTIKYFLTHPKALYVRLGKNTFLKKCDDKKYLEMLYKIRLGKKPDLNSPKTFNEKLQWLKLYDRKPIYTDMVDKAEAKKIVAEKIGNEYIIPTYGVYEKFDDINFDELPQSFVMKCTHDSGGLIVVKDKNKLNRKAAKKKINRSLKHNYFWGSREWPYKDVKPRIIIEKFMKDDVNDSAFGLVDYKFYCFNGEPQFLYVSRGLSGDHGLAEMSFYNVDWTPTGFYRDNFKSLTTVIKKPESFSDMLKIAKKLSAGIAFLRVDLYEINGKIYFSELTFSPGSGFMSFKPEGTDEKLGELLRLPEKENNKEV